MQGDGKEVEPPAAAGEVELAPGISADCSVLLDPDAGCEGDAGERLLRVPLDVGTIQQARFVRGCAA